MASPQVIDLGDVLDDVSRVPEERARIDAGSFAGDHELCAAVVRGNGDGVSRDTAAAVLFGPNPGLGWASLALGVVEVVRLRDSTGICWRSRMWRCWRVS